jgi:hypothetical protein
MQKPDTTAAAARHDLMEWDDPDAPPTVVKRRPEPKWTAWDYEYRVRDALAAAEQGL